MFCVKKLSNNFKSSITRCSCDKYGVNMYKLRSRAAADVQQQNVTASNSKTPEILLALAQYAPESLRCWETCVFSVPIHSSLYEQVASFAPCSTCLWTYLAAFSGNSRVLTLFFFGVCLPRCPQLLHHGQPHLFSSGCELCAMYTY